MKRYAILFFLAFLSPLIQAQQIPVDVTNEIEKGNFTIATAMMLDALRQGGLTAERALEYQFEIERLQRIRKDFSKSRDVILQDIRKSIPDVTEEQIAQWEQDKSLEMMVIDGEKKYFNSAGWNLFLVNPEAKLAKQKKSGSEPDPLSEFLLKELPLVLQEYDSHHQAIVKPVTMTLHYKVTVKPNAVPDGEIIRCWLPYPRTAHRRQSEISLLSTNPSLFVTAPESIAQRTLYIEKPAAKDSPTVFTMDLRFTCSSQYYDLSKSEARIPDLNGRTDLLEYVMERHPHIVFSDEIKALSQSIIGSETVPLRKAKKIFDWISSHIPWASSREYSTMQNIPLYVIENKHGDCGMTTLLFMTLCRYNGIPTKWQSGWMLHPVEINLHDWCEMYVEPYGWVPVDQSFGLQESTNDRIRNYYFGGIDSYRLIVNDDYSKNLYPAKIFPRSETVDFQRGELEWRGGNIYFDQWRYKMNIDYPLTGGK